MKIAWGITGAGHYLRESVEIMRELLKKNYFIDFYFSNAGEAVSQMYNVKTEIEGFVNEFPDNCGKIYYEKNQTPAYPVCAKFNLHAYDLLIISPISSNSVAKMNVGIADTLITNIFAQMIKGNGNVFLVPCDLIAGKIMTEIPSGKHIEILIDQFNSQNAQNLKRFPNVLVFEKPESILREIDNQI